MSTPMIRTHQVATRLQCNLCGVWLSGRLSYVEALASRAAMNPWKCEESCGGTQIEVKHYMAILPDPIATVRQVHPYAYCRPPVGPGFAWAVMEHAAAPWGPVIAEGPTEAAAWLAAAERVCG